MILKFRHHGPGVHKSGTPQSVHGKGGMAKWKTEQEKNKPDDGGKVYSVADFAYMLGAKAGEMHGHFTKPVNMKWQEQALVTLSDNKAILPKDSITLEIEARRVRNGEGLSWSAQNELNAVLPKYAKKLWDIYVDKLPNAKRKRAEEAQAESVKKLAAEEAKAKSKLAEVQKQLEAGKEALRRRDEAITKAAEARRKANEAAAEAEKAKRAADKAAGKQSIWDRQEADAKKAQEILDKLKAGGK